MTCRFSALPFSPMNASVSWTAEPNITIIEHNPVPDWLQITAATATTLGAVGVIAAVLTFWFNSAPYANEV
jgi:hypothetical protein